MRNLEAVDAREVQLWLTEREVSTYMATGNLVLVPFEDPRPGCVQLQQELNLDQLETWISWTDDDGPHEEPRREARPT